MRSSSRRPPEGADALALERALRLARLPGLTLAEAAARAGVSRADLVRARAARGPGPAPSREDILLGALTGGGASREGALGSLSSLASWLDHVNRDGSTPAEVVGILQLLVARGVLEIEGDRWHLLGPWP